MKKATFIFLHIFLIIMSEKLISQSTRTFEPISSGGYFDEVRDKDGNIYSLGALQVKLNDSNAPNYVNSTTTCQAGFFNVYFANGSGMESVGNATHTARRNTVCEVLQNISGLLKWANWSSTVTVNMLVDNIANYVSTPSTSNFLGVATAFYAYPSNPSSSYPGLIENQIQKTIKSQQDAWNGIVSPFLTTGGSNYYHGLMAFNFDNTSFNWHTAYSTTVATSTQYDLYTIILHEVVHSLGFASLISGTGVSKYGSSNNYYSNYDKFLNDKNNNPLLTTGGCSPQYSLAFTGSSSLLAPNCSTNYPTDATTCSTACLYSSSSLTNVSIYTPDCFESASSLSHFEDMCYPANTPSNNNQYFLMSNSNGMGMNKRYLKEEERKVLCNLGYSVNATYTSNATVANFTYVAGNCNPAEIWGQNDGITNSGYTYTSTGGSFTVNISSGPNNILANDAGSASSATCIETIYNNGTVSISGNVITFAPAANYSGPVLLRYIPVDASGNQGNITYIHGYIFPTGCTPVSPCDLIQNGGFESNVGCGLFSLANKPSCWNTYIHTPDFFVSGCTTFSLFPANLGVNTYSSNPVFNSHSPGTNSTVVGLGGYCEMWNGPNTNEAIYTFLGAPLVNGQIYTLSFWAYQYSGNMLDGMAVPLKPFNTSSVSLVLSFATSPSILLNNQLNFPPSNLNTVISPSLMPVFNSWVPYTYTFTFLGTSPTTHSVLYVGLNGTKTFTNLVNALGTSTNIEQYYVLVDDISIKPTSQTAQLSLPASSLCAGIGYTNLAQYVNIAGGIFTGTGVTVVTTTNGPQYNFNAPTATLGSGQYVISYTYTDNIGCTQTINQQVSIGGTTNLLPINYTGGCSNNTGTLSIVTPSAGSTYTWQPNSSTGTAVVVTTSVPTIYTVTSTSNSLCTQMNYISILPNIPTLTISLNSPTICPNISTLTASGNFTSLSWSPINSSLNPVLVNSSVTVIYTIQVTSWIGCSVSQTFAVNSITVSPDPPSFTLSSISPTNCANLTTTLSATGNYTTLVWSPNSSTVNPVVVSPSLNLTYTATATSSNGCIGTQTIGVNTFSVILTAFSPTICSGASSTLTATGNFTNITWQHNSSNSYSTVVNPTVSTTYTAIANNSLDCTISQTVLVTVVSTLNISPTLPTFCNGDSQTLTLNGGFITSTVQPGGSTVNPIVVSPTASTTYSAAASFTNGCISTCTYAILNNTACCSNTLSAITGPTLSSQTFTGTNTFQYDVTVAANNTLALKGVFLMAPNVKITVPSGSKLIISDSHIYACQNTMWQGIVVENGGVLEASNETKDNLIEDAITAISVSTHTSLSNPILLISQTTFNKNYIGINISNSPISSTSHSLVFNIYKCVFTSRDLPFSSSQWPQTGITSSVSSSSADLRYVSPSTPTTGLTPPYLGQTNFTITNLKNPYSTQPSDWAIRLVNVGTTTSGNYNGIKIGDESSATNFNLFDGHRNFIYVWNSNLNSFNNVFQNTQYINVSKHSYAGAAIFAYCNYTMNTNLNLSSPGTYSTNPDLGNRFWNCHTGIVNNNTYLFSAKYATFRSNQSTSGGSSYLPGNKGIYNVTSRFKYEISYNEFSNINTGIIFAANAGFYNMGSGNQMGIYANGLSITYNYFGPKTTTASSISNNEYTNHGIVITGGNQVNWASVSGTEISIRNNTIDRIYRGVYHSVGGGYHSKIMSNTIKLVNDNVFNQTQRGIELVVGLSNPLVRANLLSGWSSTVTLKSLFYGSYNGGAKVICNELIDCYEGFIFEGPNQGTYWRGNKMESHTRGLALKTTGVISPQGSAGNPIDNQWNGSWNGKFHTYVIASSGTISPLTVKTGTPWTPSNNSGTLIPSSQWYGGPGTLSNTTGSYTSCLGVHPSNLVAPLGEDYDSDDLKYSADNTLYRYLFLNDSIRDNVAEMSTFYTDLSGSSHYDFMQIEGALYEGDLNEARSLNTGITATNTIETNYKTYYTLYANYADSSFRHTTADDSTDLYNLAQLCPNTNGSVIYQARALYITVYAMVIDYEDCQEDGSERNMNLTLSNNTDIKEKWDVNIYPNPASNSINIICNQETEFIDVLVRDVTGRTTLSTSLKMTNFIANLDIRLLSGAYFITISNANGEKTTKKLLVAQ